jgi:hypothetical protein
MFKRKLKSTAALALLFTIAATMTFAKPAFMDRYNADSYSKTALHNKCTVCHVGHGGGERNDFGEAFEDQGYRITPKLREKFPQLFQNQLANSSAGRDKSAGAENQHN